MLSPFFRLLFLNVFLMASANNHAKRLYEKLLRQSGYNKLIRPVLNETETLIVKIGLRLSQLIDVDEQNQLMTANVWVLMEWHDPTLKWQPDENGNVDLIYVPAAEIWHPDVVLYNTGDGSYEMTAGTKAILSSNGTVKWRPPATFKSSCSIDVKYFPFDEQKCNMSFGSWTYNIQEVDLVYYNSSMDETYIEDGIDLKDFYISVEWHVMRAPANKSTHHYAGSDEDFARWTFSLTLRRKFLFYTVNLIIPLVSHALITILVFYLPADGKKISLCINILLSLTVFFLMLAEIIPPSSMVVPLLGQYLIFTMFLVTFSVIITVVTYNVHFRSSATHVMSDWTRKIFLYYLPRVLMMRRPKIENSHDVELKHIKLKLSHCFGAVDDRGNYADGTSRRSGAKHAKTDANQAKKEQSESAHLLSTRRSQCSAEVQNAIDGAVFIANHLKQEDEFRRTKEDWKYVALVVDRIFLLIYIGVCICGTAGIICQAPMLYDSQKPIK